MALRHAATGLNHIHDCGARRQQVHTGIGDTARNGIAAQTFATIFLGARQHLRPLAADPRDPMQGLYIVHQRRLSKDPNLRHERRAVARHTALAFNTFDHRAFFAADIGPGTAPQVDIAGFNKSCVFQCFDLATQNFQNGGVFIAHV